MPDTLIHAAVARHVRGSARYKASLASELVEFKHDLLVKAALAPLISRMNSELAQHEARLARPKVPKLVAITQKLKRKNT
jgi:hypothetical protein